MPVNGVQGQPQRDLHQLNEGQERRPHQPQTQKTTDKKARQAVQKALKEWSQHFENQRHSNTKPVFRGRGNMQSYQRKK